MCFLLFSTLRVQLETNRETISPPPPHNPATRITAEERCKTNSAGRHVL